MQSTGGDGEDRRGAKRPLTEEPKIEEEAEEEDPESQGPEIVRFPELSGVHGVSSTDESLLAMGMERWLLDPRLRAVNDSRALALISGNIGALVAIGRGFARRFGIPIEMPSRGEPVGHAPGSSSRDAAFLEELQQRVLSDIRSEIADLVRHEVRLELADRDEREAEREEMKEREAAARVQASQ